MVTRVSVRRRPAVFAALGFILAVAGCQSGNPIGALNIAGGQRDSGQERITSDELLAYCPAVQIRARQAVHDTFQRGGQDDPQKLVYRASITDATRACTYNGGTMGMTVAVAGRVVPGPAGAAGSVTVPIRIIAYRDQEVIHEQVYNHQVAISDVAGATQFVFSDSSISMPTPTSRNVLIFVAFDVPERS